MKNVLMIACAVGIMSTSYSQQSNDPKATEVWGPEPAVVSPGSNGSAPSDALVLFDGKNLDQWADENGKPSKWVVKDNAMTVQPGSGAIKTKRAFGDIQLHIEWRTPAEVKGDGQNRGNSGVFLQERYELQVLDSYNNKTYVNGQAGSIYKQYPPLVNATKGPGEWQTYDIIFMAPRFNADGGLLSPGRMTVLLNGVLIQNNVELKGTSTNVGLPKYEAHGVSSIMLQDHGNPTSFRNIWVRELK
jgi:hypothetical protein